MNRDFQDILTELLKTEARFLIGGAHALAVYGVPRATGDLDVWIQPDPENARRVWDALVNFGAPVASLKIAMEDLHRLDTVIQIGLPPSRINLLTSVSGVEFDEAWSSRMEHAMGETRVPFISRELLVINKRATGRLKDLADLESLGEAQDPS